MKRIFNIIFALYISFALILGSVGIPYLIHTCQNTLKKDVHLFAATDNSCDDFHQPCCTKKKIKKEEDCCSNSSGYVTLDIETFYSNQSTFDIDNQSSILAFYAKNTFIFSKEIVFKHYSSKAPPLFSSGKQIRISQQSFLC